MVSTILERILWRRYISWLWVAGRGVCHSNPEKMRKKLRHCPAQKAGGDRSHRPDRSYGNDGKTGSHWAHRSHGNDGKTGRHRIHRGDRARRA